MNLEKLKKKYNKKVNTESQLNNLEAMDQEENLENVYQNVKFNQVSDKMVQINYFFFKFNLNNFI